MAGYDDVRTSTVALVGFIGALVVFVLIVAMEVVYYQVVARQQQVKDIDQPYVELAGALAKQEARLIEKPGFDEKAGIGHVPLGQAMKLVIADVAAHGDGQGAPAGLVTPGAPPASKPAKEKDHAKPK
jgi:hypothetical protein